MKPHNKLDGTRRRLALEAGEGVRRLLDPRCVRAQTSR
jgi:hypothetical protein